MPEARWSARILPGICQRQAGAEDVMRGEETQLLGLGTLWPGFDGVVCMPGTHSKWVRLAGRRVERFATAMTGELFEVLRTHSVLRHSLAGPLDGPHRDVGFEAGLDAGVASPQALSATLFKVRAASLLSARSPDWCAGFLSGLLIGSEIGAQRHWIGCGRGGHCRRRRACRAVSEGRVGDRRQVPHRRWHRCDPHGIENRTAAALGPPMTTTHRHIIAILRGIQPQEAVAVCETLARAGITLIEVPLNSPRPFDSIVTPPRHSGQRLDRSRHRAEREGGRSRRRRRRCLRRIARLQRGRHRPYAGARIALLPRRVLAHRGIPGHPRRRTWSEDFPGRTGRAGRRQGHDGGVAARSPALCGWGASPDNFAAYIAAGATGFGIGSYLYKPGATVVDIEARAKAVVAAYDTATAR